MSIINRKRNIPSAVWLSGVLGSFGLSLLFIGSNSRSITQSKLSGSLIESSSNPVVQTSPYESPTKQIYDHGQFLESFNASGASLLFAHVPKAGGQSVQSLLNSWGEVNGIKVLKHFEEKNLDDSLFSSKYTKQIFFGHEVWGQYLSIMKSYAGVSKGGRDLREPLKVVVMREPLSQLVSFYDYIMHKKCHNRYKNFWELYGGGTLDSHLIKMMDDIEKNGIPTTKATERLWRITHSQMDFLRTGIHGFDNTSGSLDSYQNALLHLERFHVIATLKSMDSSLLPQLKYWLPWADKSLTKILTINSIAEYLNEDEVFVKSIVSKDTAERMKKNFMKYDYKLYSMAVELSHERLEFVKKMNVLVNSNGKDGEAH
mmetsp:Transcript_1943/g.4174  ORF Transcript_1943/g.4174 Transcript_1943/m.4174 type:complete len:372 (-) Transcript_1943:58-1173(-)